MAKRRKSDGGSDVRLNVKGFFRVQLVNRKTGRIVGDTGYMRNQITNYGLNSCVVARPIGAGLAITSMVIGTASTPAATDNTLGGSNTGQYSALTTSLVASLTARMTQAFQGSNSSMAVVGNVGVIGNSTGSLVAGKGFATSELGTDQSLNVTYELRYSTT